MLERVRLSCQRVILPTAQKRWRIRGVRDAHFERWRTLYRSYADFYGIEQSDVTAETVWSWIGDP